MELQQMDIIRTMQMQALSSQSPTTTTTTPLQMYHHTKSWIQSCSCVLPILQWLF